MRNIEFSISEEPHAKTYTITEQKKTNTSEKLNFHNTSSKLPSSIFSIKKTKRMVLFKILDLIIVSDSRSGKLIGKIRESKPFFGRRRYFIEDDKGVKQMRIVRKRNHFCCFKSKSRKQKIYEIFDEAKILNSSKKDRIGKLSGDSSELTVEFPPILTVEMKLCLMAMAFMIDFWYFVDHGKSDGVGVCCCT